MGRQSFGRLLARYCCQRCLVWLRCRRSEVVEEAMARAPVVSVDLTEVPETEPEVCSEAGQVQRVPEIVVEAQRERMVEGGRWGLAMGWELQQAR